MGKDIAPFQVAMQFQITPQAGPLYLICSVTVTVTSCICEFVSSNLWLPVMGLVDYGSRFHSDPIIGVFIDFMNCTIH